MAAPAQTPVKTLRAAGPVIVVILLVAAAFLGYYQIVYYPTVAPTSSTSTSSSVGPLEKNVTVIIPNGAQTPNLPTSQTYLPNVITVYIGYNATVIWYNNDSALHTVTAKPNSPDPKFNAWGPTSAPYNNRGSKCHRYIHFHDSRHLQLHLHISYVDGGRSDSQDSSCWTNYYHDECD